MSKESDNQPERICFEGLVHFNVSICVDRNAIVQSCDGGNAHDIAAKCFHHHPPHPPYELAISPLTAIEELSDPERRTTIKNRVNTRALISLLLALADADFEAALLRTDYI